MERSLAKNAFFNFCYMLFNVLFPLISTAYVARILYADGVGKVAGAQNIAQYFVAFAALGMGSYGTKKIAAAVSRKETTKAFSEIFCINAISTSICVILYYILIFTLPYFASDFHLFFVVGLGIVLNFFNVEWFYQGKEEYKFIMIRSIIIKICSLFLLFAFVKQKDDYVYYALIVCLATAGNYLLNFVHLRKHTDFTMRDLELINHLRPILILFASSIAIDLYTMVDTTMLNLLRTSVEVGYYTNAVKIIRIASNCIIAIGAVMLPRISLCVQKNDEAELRSICKSMIRLLIFYALPAAVGMWMIADSAVITLFGSGFEGSISIVRILAVLIFVFAIAGGFTAPVLIATNREKQYLYSVLSGAVVNIALNSVLIPELGQTGAAIASLCAEIVVLLVQMYHCRFIHLQLSLRKPICKCAIAVVFMAAGIYIVKHFFSTNISILIVSLAVGVSTYFVAGALLGNEEAIAMLNRIGKLLKKAKKTD